uniref:Uncharacterized protein n=1 Tax=Cacopsylla melanoneura TaxID=428564 RepID=A0A8D8ZNR0_9HEMI
MRGGIPQRAPGSKSLRDRLSTRQRVESRKNVRKPTGRPTSQNASKTRPNGSHQSSRPEGDPEKKPLGSTRPNGPSRRVPMKASARGNRLRPPTNQAIRGRDGDRPSRPLREGAQRGVPRFRKPNLPHPRNDRNQRYDNRRDQRNFNDRPYQSDAPGPENYGHQGQQPVHSTKDLLFKGPKKGCKYSEEDLKKIKVDIRPSLAEREANMFDQAELKKLKVDIKGENFDSKRGDVMYRDSHGVPYDKKVLESVKVNIKRKLGPEVMHQSHAIKRNLELDKFCVPPQYKERQMLNSRPTFTHTSAGAKDYEKRDLSLKVNIVRQVPNPTNEPLRDEFHEDSFKMYRRQDVSPPRGNRKVIVEDRNRQFRDNQQEYHHDSRKFQTWQDEGSKPVFSNKNVAPNSVHLADIFPSERDRRESHSRPPPRLTHLDGPPQKFSEHDRDRQSRQRDREGELHNRRHPPPSKEPGHYGRSYSGKPYNLGSRALLPTPGEGKGQPLQSSDSRAGDYEMGRSLGGKDKYQRREPSPPPPPSLRPYDNYKPSDRPGRRSRSRSPLRRSPGKDSRDYPARTQQPFSTPRGSMAPSPRKRPLSPAPLEDKYRDRPFVDEKYRDKPFGDDKYRDKPFGDEKYRSDRPNLEEKYRSEKPIFDSYQDKPFGDEKYRDKPFGDDKYRDKPFGVEANFFGLFDFIF